MTPQQHQQILHALTRYDERASKSKGYNRYAFAHYCAAIDKARDLTTSGLTIRQALCKCFTDRLLDCVLRSVGEALATREEMRGWL